MNRGLYDNRCLHDDQGAVEEPGDFCQLKQKSAELRIRTAALEKVSNSVVITDRNGVILWANPAFIQLTGYTLEEAAGKTPRLIKSDHHDEAHYKKLWDTILSGQTWRGELINQRKDGSLYCVEQTITPVLSDGGEISYFVGIMNDTTERKWVEDDIRSTNTFLRQLLDLTPAVIYRLRIDGNDIIPLSVNENITTLLGYTAADTLSYEWWLGHVHPRDLDRALAGISDTLIQGSSRLEYRMRHKDGDYRWVDDNRRLIRDTNGKPSEFVGVMTDITGRKRAEEVIRRTSLREVGRRKRNTLIEAGAIFLLCVLVFLASDYFDLFLPAFNYVILLNGDPNTHADETAGTLVFLCIALLIFSYRRVKESKAEAVSQASVMGALRQLNNEMDARVQQRTTQLAKANEALNLEIAERKRAEEELRFQTMLLEAQSEASIDGILTVDANAKIISFNHRFVEMWKIPGTLVAARSDEPVLKRVLHDVVDPEGFLSRIQYLNEHPDLTSQDEILLKNGGVFDRYTSPVKGSDGTYYGRIWTFRDVTERKRTEESLGLFRALMEESNDAIEVIDPETGRFIDCNETTWKRLGYTREELLSLGVLDISPLMTPAGLRNVIDEICATGSKTFEVIHKRKDGSTFPVEENVRHVHLNRSYLLAVVRDITERKKSERVLRESERRFREMLENVDLIAMTLDKEGRMTFCNDYLLQLTGWERNEVVGQDWFAQFRPEIDEDEKNMFRTNIVNGSMPARHESRINTRRGDQREIVWTNTTLRDGAGNHIGTASIGEDVTDRKQAAEQIMKQAALLDQTRDAIVVHGLAGRILFWNKGAEKMFGWTSKEAIGRTNAELFQQNETILQEALDATVGKGEWSGELHKLTKDGRTLIVDARWTLVRDSEGNPETILATNTDVTEKKQIESQLRQAQKLESIGQLAAGIAHEINTPTQYIGDNIRFVQQSVADMDELMKKFEELLALVKGNKPATKLVSDLETFAAGIDVPYLRLEVPKAIRESMQGLDRVRNIVGAMKEFSHPGSNEKTLTDLNRAIETTITVTRNEWKYVAEVRTDFDADLPRVPCLPGEFNQVMLNLIINAAHAIADVVGDGCNGKGLITVSTRRCDDWVEIRVHDSGTGIPVAAQEKIFEPFFTTKPVGKGTGQGLTISHSVIVEKHKGSITFETQAGAGTTFIVRLPINPPQ